MLPGVKRPAIRIGRTLIYPDGAVRRLGPIEYALFKLGVKTTVTLIR